MRRRRGAPLPSDREEGQPNDRSRGDFRFRRRRRRSRRRDGGRRSREPGPQGCASRPERTHQALRRRDPAAADPRFRNSEPSFEGAGAACDDDLAKRAVGRHADRWRRFRRNGGPRTRSTNGCAIAQPNLARRGLSADTRRSRVTAMASARVHFTPKAGATEQILKTRFVIGADGANSAVGRQEVPGAARGRFVFAYHEIIATPRRGDEAIGRVSLRDPLPGNAVARFLRMDLPARRHDERRLRAARKRAFR